MEDPDNAPLAFIDQPALAPSPVFEEDPIDQIMAHHRAFMFGADLADPGFDVLWHRGDSLIHLFKERRVIWWPHLVRRDAPEDERRGIRPGPVFRQAQKIKEADRFRGSCRQPGRIAGHGMPVPKLQTSRLDRNLEDDAAGVVPSGEACRKAWRRQEPGTAGRFRYVSERGERFAGELPCGDVAVLELAVGAWCVANQKFRHGDGLRFDQHDAWFVTLITIIAICGAWA